MKYLNSKAITIIREMIIATMPKIKVKGGICRFNYRCHANAVNDAVVANQDRIAMCFYLIDNDPILHFVNINEEGEYIDNTIGVWAERYDYYLIRIIDKEQFFDILDIFVNYRKELRSRLPLYVRWFSDESF